MSQYFRLPAQVINASNPSVGTNSASAPANSSQSGAVDPSGNLQPLQVDATKNLKVAIQSTPANQSVNLTQVSGTALTQGQKVMASSLPVVIASDQSQLPTKLNDGSGSPISSTANALNVNVSNSAPLTTQDQSAGPVSPGTPATKSLLNGVIYNSTLPTATTGQQVAVQADSNGRILVGSIASALPAGTNILGKVGIDPASTLPVGSNVIGKVGIDPTSTLPAGTNLLGKTGIDQTTPGTTNAVAVSTFGTAPVNTGNGTSGTGTLRVVLASDQTSNTNPLLTNARQVGAFTDRSGSTSATATTSTTIAPANSARKYFMIVNTSTANTIWINFTTAANLGQPSIPIGPYGSFVMESGFVTSEAINVICSVASSPFSAKEG